MTQYNYSSCDLLSKFVKFLVSFFNFFIQSLVFNLKLFEIDQVKTICKLLLFLKDLLLIGKSISKSDILESVLMHLLVL